MIFCYDIAVARNYFTLMWRNWQTHWTQNPAGNHVGSSPTISTNNVSVRTNRTDRKNTILKKDGIFLVLF